MSLLMDIHYQYQLRARRRGPQVGLVRLVQLTNDC